MKTDYIRYPKSPQDIYDWIDEGYTGTISYSKLSGYERGNYPGVMRTRDKNGNWVNILIPMPDKAWENKKHPWDAIIDSLKDDTQDWLGTGWTLTRNSGWIFFTPKELQKKYSIKHPGHPNFRWWFSHFAYRHQDIMDAVDDLPMDFQLNKQPDVLPEGLENAAHPAVPGNNVDLQPILNHLKTLEKQLEDVKNQLYNICMVLGV
jgi:hypothetical protein